MSDGIRGGIPGALRPKRVALAFYAAGKVRHWKCTYCFFEMQTAGRDKPNYCPGCGNIVTRTTEVTP